jgi:undecaprenyl-diphosphatase
MPLWIAVILLGIVEGITEFLPVSSTGHLLITERLLQVQEAGLFKSDLFNIVIQSGAVLAILPLFPERLKQFLFKWQDRQTQLYAGKILLAFVMTAIGGFILDKKGFKLADNPIPIAIALFLGGVGFLAVEAWLRGRPLQDEVTWGMAAAVGLGQLVAAVFPGTSRSGVTILACLVFGLARPAATEFTFLVGIPTMLAAGGWKILKALHHAPEAASENWSLVLLGFLVSAVVSFIAVKWLLRYIQTHTFVVFGWYRIALAGFLAALIFIH